MSLQYMELTVLMDVFASFVDCFVFTMIQELLEPGRVEFVFLE